VPGKNSIENYDVASFAGGSVFSASSVRELVEEYKNLSYFNVSNVPNYFERNTTNFRYAQHEIYTYTWNESHYLEFKINPVDFVVPIYPRTSYDSPQNLYEIMKTIVPYFNVCSEWEVKVDREGCAGHVPPDSHVLFGHRCVKTGGCVCGSVLMFCLFLNFTCLIM
jgi:hypothetical protein